MFQLVSQYHPTGDQPEAIRVLTENVEKKIRYQTLLGATGTGKTYTIANVIANTNKNTLVLAHNKTLAGQLYSELKAFFPHNHVEYFISYYDYYQPEAYVASKDLYIEKDSSINDDIDQMRHSTVSSLLTEENVIVVSSVSCIYGIGDPEDYRQNLLIIKRGQKINREQLFMKLINMQYERNDYDLKRGTFRSKGDTIDIILTGE
ncbi:MAG: DEAD/DEAH box helicase family protein, partial [Bacilli bacterium]|nr:DEAD/DEAH box helicase family protein [Bacilli bacterium]